MKHQLLIAIAATILPVLGGCSVKNKAAADFVPPQRLEIGVPKAHFPLDLERQEFLSPSQAHFRRVPNTWTWTSDVEHVIEKTEKKLIVLADGDPAYYMCGDTVPADREFELFPYHYYDEWEVEQLGGQINYKMIAQNRTNEYLTIEITGAGTVTNWDNQITWRDALAGKGKRTITLKPGESVTLWEEKQLKGGLPWSGIFLGSASGDLFVADYCYLGEEDPGIDNAEPMPDLSWPPYLLASFSRGGTDWNAAEIDLFPRRRNHNGRIKMSECDDRISSFAFAYSPGGPITDLCRYNAVAPTWVDDYFSVKDPLSKWSHPFFGGNYPVMYRFRLPLINDTDRYQTLNFYLASNDRFGVDTLAGVWIDGQMLNDRVALWKKNEHWRIFSVTLAPGEEYEQAFVVVPLGSRWGGMIGSVEIVETPTH
jgi:hypothetical protein